MDYATKRSKYLQKNILKIRWINNSLVDEKTQAVIQNPLSIWDE